MQLFSQNAKQNKVSQWNRFLFLWETIFWFQVEWKCMLPYQNYKYFPRDTLEKINFLYCWEEQMLTDAFTNWLGELFNYLLLVQALSLKSQANISQNLVLQSRRQAIAANKVWCCFNTISLHEQTSKLTPIYIQWKINAKTNMISEFLESTYLQIPWYDECLQQLSLSCCQLGKQ